MSETLVTLGGQDWDEIVTLARESGDSSERIVVNMGPVSYTHLTLPTIYSV